MLVVKGNYRFLEVVKIFMKILGGRNCEVERKDMVMFENNFCIVRRCERMDGKFDI